MQLLLCVAILAACFLLLHLSFATVELQSASNDSNLFGRQEYSPHFTELMLIYREADIFQRIAGKLRSQGFSLHGFYHTSTWKPKWKEVISEQLMLLDGRRLMPVTPVSQNSTYQWSDNLGASLLAASDGLHMTVSGSSAEDKVAVEQLVNGAGLLHRRKININFNETVGRLEYREADEAGKKLLDANPTLSAGEFATINKLHEYCIEKTQSKEKAMVYYFHSKGGCCFRQRGSRKRMPVASWRDLMNAFTLEFPSICIRALLQGYHTCGAENQNAHYSGNFWWADCRHVAALEMPQRFNPWDQEFFIQRYAKHGDIATKMGFQCGYSTFNCGLGLYRMDCWRDMYRSKIFDMVMGDIGPSNRKEQRVNVSDFCRNMLTNNYFERREEIRINLRRAGIQ